jgi:Dyp-type peroxidase family
MLLWLSADPLVRHERGPQMSAIQPDLGNIQANILHGSGRWKSACYLFLRVDERSNAEALLARLLEAGYVGTGNPDPGPKRSSNVNVAFTRRGLTAMDYEIDDEDRYKRTFLMRPLIHADLAIPDAEDHGPPESAFAAGMRSADVGDVWPEDHKGTYRWDGDKEAYAWWSDDKDQKAWVHVDEWPHLLIWISAISTTALKRVSDAIQTAIDDVAGVSVSGCQYAKVLDDGKEHFGFVDGISQPAIEGIRSGKPGDGKLGARGWQGLPVGEFILGYPDEGHDPTGGLGQSHRAKDGTFLVYRKLRQDVKGFRQAARDMASTGHDTALDIEAKMMGRCHNGNPLVMPQGESGSSTQETPRNDFTYAGDPDGYGCPLGSHVRRANPRDDLHFEGRRVNRHRIIRRGMPYGSSYDSDDPYTGNDRGLIFIAFNARIEDQFEFIQKQWLSGGRPFRIGDDAEPVAGYGENIRIIINGEHPVLHSQPMPFTKFLGGDYFFVPSMSALAEIASGHRGVPPSVYSPSPPA